MLGGLRALAVLGAGAVVAIGAAGPSVAADAKSNFALHGIGAQTCAVLAKEVAQPNSPYRLQFADWMMGYITAVNRMRGDTFDIMPVLTPDALVNWAIGICQGNPKALGETVVATIVNSLSAARARHESPLVEAKTSAGTAVIRQEVLTAVQNALIKGKHLRGKADGEFGASTEAALKAFQKAEKLKETGLPDLPTVVRLLAQDQAQQHEQPQPKKRR